MTEDQVRSRAAEILGFSNPADDISGVGQLTTFNQLGFRGVMDKPDGWYLPANLGEVAIILEVKCSTTNITTLKCIAELLKNVKIARRKYRRVVGILYNGEDVLVYKNVTRVSTINTLQSKEYYLGLWNVNQIDKQKIYRLTKRINDNLHFNFKVKNLYHRMIVTACALVAEKHGATLVRVKDLGWNTFQTRIKTTLESSFASAVLQNEKLKLLLKTFDQIEVHFAEQDTINDFIDCVVEISNSINSDYWNGEDVMAIFFNEFNRYKGKSEAGQVFTPDHITSLMYRLVEVNKNDVVLDAACGSGSFLVKSMCNMIKEAGGAATQKAKDIKANQLFGIENDAQIFALACANMLIHKDGKTNLAFLDSRTDAAARWIRSKPITKVLMNPPFEKKYGCLDIVKTVLDNVAPRTLCAFIMPDKKLEKDLKGRKLLRGHTLKKILKLPESVFSEVVSTSVFIFEAGVPQSNKRIFACYMEDDGLETVKGQGRHDIKNLWPDLEDYWVDVMYRQKDKMHNTDQWLDPSKSLSYQLPDKGFVISPNDFRFKVMSYMMFERGIDAKNISEKLIRSTLFGDASNSITARSFALLNTWMRQGERLGDVAKWESFLMEDLFVKLDLRVLKPKFNKRTDVSAEKTMEYTLPLVNAKHGNNGVQFYGRPEDFASEEMAIDVVKNGASATGDVYAQPQRTGVLWDAYLIKPKDDKALNTEILLFLATVLERTIKDKFSYDDKCIWEKIKGLSIRLPAQKGLPDWRRMQKYVFDMRLVAARYLDALSMIVKG